MKRIVYLGNVWAYPKALADLPGAELAAIIYEDPEDVDDAVRTGKGLGVRTYRAGSDPDVGEALREVGPVDLAVMANFGTLLSEASLAGPKGGVINFHPGSLPEQAGRSPVSKLWANGGGSCALTVHRAVLRPDAGPVLAVYSSHVDPKSSLSQNLARIYRLGISFFPQLLSL